MARSVETVERLWRLIVGLHRRGNYWGELVIPFHGPKFGQFRLTQGFVEDTIPDVDGVIVARPDPRPAPAVSPPAPREMGVS